MVKNKALNISEEALIGQDQIRCVFNDIRIGRQARAIPTGAALKLVSH
jgi:hypothetical protein